MGCAKLFNSTSQQLSRAGTVIVCHSTDEESGGRLLKAPSKNPQLLVGTSIPTQAISPTPNNTQHSATSPAGEKPLAFMAL